MNKICQPVDYYQTATNYSKWPHRQQSVYARYEVFMTVVALAGAGFISSKQPCDKVPVKLFCEPLRAVYSLSLDQTPHLSCPVHSNSLSNACLSRITCDTTSPPLFKNIFFTLIRNKVSKVTSQNVTSRVRSVVGKDVFTRDISSTVQDYIFQYNISKVISLRFDITKSILNLTEVTYLSSRCVWLILSSSLCGLIV